MIDLSNIVKNIGDIPNYIDNDDLRKIINIGIHDTILHSNNINKQSSVVFDLTVHKKIDTNRTINCKTSFIGAVPNEYTYNPISENIETPDSSNTKINYPIVRRITVEPSKHTEIVNKDIIIED
jgi:hypothetical protein